MTQPTAKSRAILNRHPSVQDLNIQYDGVNLFKSNIHKMLINHKPLHDTTPSELKAARKNVDGGVMSPGARVTVVKNSCTPARPIRGMMSPSVKERNYISKRTSLHWTEDIRTPVSSSTNSERKKYITPTSNTMTTSSSLGKKVIPRITHPDSLVSTEFSYNSEGCSDCDTFSLYSCSCCHAKPPSTIGSAATSASMANLSVYDNMSSVSQRHNGKALSTTTSVSSSKLKSLKEELEAERKSRMQTQEELKEIRRRQSILMNRLSYEERKTLEEAMQAKPMKKNSFVEHTISNSTSVDVNDNCRAYMSKKMQIKLQSRPHIGPFELEDGDSLFA